MAQQTQQHYIQAARGRAMLRKRMLPGHYSTPLLKITSKVNIRVFNSVVQSVQTDSKLIHLSNSADWFHMGLTQSSDTARLIEAGSMTLAKMETTTCVSVWNMSILDRQRSPSSVRECAQMVCAACTCAYRVICTIKGGEGGVDST